MKTRLLEGFAAEALLEHVHDEGSLVARELGAALDRVQVVRVVERRLSGVVGTDPLVELLACESQTPTAISHGHCYRQSERLNGAPRHLQETPLVFVVAEHLPIEEMVEMAREAVANPYV